MTRRLTADLPGGATMDFVWIEAGTFTMGTSVSGLRRGAAGRDRGDPDSKGDYLGARLLRTG